MSNTGPGKKTQKTYRRDSKFNVFFFLIDIFRNKTDSPAYSRKELLITRISTGDNLFLAFITHSYIMIFYQLIVGEG